MFDASDVGGQSYLIERRQAPRHRSYLGAQLLDSHRGLTAPCVVRNTSPDGAAIDAPPSDLMAGDPLLVIPKHGVAYETRTVWMGQRRAGLRFLAAHPLNGEVAGIHRQARNLWLETLPRKT